VLYFIQEGQDGPIKIGFTDENINRRLTQLQTGNPKKLVCLGTRAGGEQDELNLHCLFAAHHIRGEWFSPAPELLDYIQSLCHPDPRRDRAYPWGKLYEQCTTLEERQAVMRQRWQRVQQ
jgi:hypothetical protein